MYILLYKVNIKHQVCSVYISEHQYSLRRKTAS